jgi:hypothetical protein
MYRECILDYMCVCLCVFECVFACLFVCLCVCVDKVTTFFSNVPDPSSCTTILGLTQLLSEMSIRECSLGIRARPARKADNLTAICEPIV